MRPDAPVFHFGPFELNPGRHRLLRGRERVPLPDAHINLLLLFAAHAGEILSIDSLADAGWHETAVTDNNVAQAVSRLRKTLGRQDDGAPFIENVAGRGYRFAAPVDRRQPRQPAAAIDELLAPFSRFVEGRAALETLMIPAVVRARQAFEEALRQAPDHPAAHVGLANALTLLFEATRTDAEPDLAALRQAEDHARNACCLAPSSADAWSTLGMVLYRTGEAHLAIPAVRKAVTLEPDEWRHHLRLACVSWGSARLLAARQLLKIYGNLSFAHWFAATVYVARGQFADAIEDLRAGCAAQDDQRRQTERFNAVGLHLLLGLVLAARGADDEALDEIGRELACGDADHVYARECLGNCWYAIGAIHLRRGRRDEADAAFQKALTYVSAHGLAATARAVISGVSPVPPARSAAHIVDVAAATAAALACHGRHHDAARVCAEALAESAPGSAGWLLTVDPLLHATGHPDAWAQTLSLLRHRAA